MTTVEAGLGMIRGLRLAAGGRLFAGIPFASPPIGPLRFRAPQPLAAWDGVLDATVFPAQPTQPTQVFSNRPVSDPIPTSEDCLYLNVWVPDCDGVLPVIVWFYGGAFEVGSASPPATDAAELARSLGAIIVAVNYRVGALGFAHLADIGGAGWEGSTNLGFQDQAAGLWWVRNNIAAFGGDVDNVTIAGQSAGAFSVGTLLALPAATGTFHKAIMHSGSTSRVIPTDVANSLATDLLATLNISSVEQLTDVSTDDILRAQKAVVDVDLGHRNLPGGRAWGAVIDGHVLPTHPHKHVTSGGVKDIPLLSVGNQEEFRTFALLQADTFAPVNEQALLEEMGRIVARPAQLLAAYRLRDERASLTELRTAFLSDVVYRRPISAAALAQVAAGGLAYTALLTAAPYGPELGAFHGADLFYVFGGNGFMPGTPLPDSTEFLAVQKDFRDIWRQFITTGDPGWPVHSTTTTREIGGASGLLAEPPLDEVGRAWAS
jgi:para-nitrobenzyl esterase